MTIPENRFLILLVIVHDKGELCIDRDGCVGGEYFTVEDGVKRLSELMGFGYKISLHLYFTKNDSEDGFYLPEKKVQKEWKDRLKKIGVDGVTIDIANVETKDGRVSLRSFYHQRDLGRVGFIPSNSRTEKDLLENDAFFGVDSFAYSGLYKEYKKDER